MKRHPSFPSSAQSILFGMGSIFSLASLESMPTPRQLVRADRDAQAMRSDFTRVGRDVRSALDKSRKQLGRR